MSRAEEVTKELFKPFTPVETKNGNSLSHGAWMMNNLPAEAFTRQRWIGYAQCLLVTHGVITLMDLRDATRPVKRTSPAYEPDAQWASDPDDEV